jgi:hypothetical protein
MEVLPVHRQSADDSAREAMGDDLVCPVYLAWEEPKADPPEVEREEQYRQVPRGEPRVCLSAAEREGVRVFRVVLLGLAPREDGRWAAGLELEL